MKQHFAKNLGLPEMNSHPFSVFVLASVGAEQFQPRSPQLRDHVTSLGTFNILSHQIAQTGKFLVSRIIHFRRTFFIDTDISHT